MVIPLINQDPPLGRPLEPVYDDAEGFHELGVLDDEGLAEHVHHFGELADDWVEEAQEAHHRSASLAGRRGRTAGLHRRGPC